MWEQFFFRPIFFLGLLELATGQERLPLLLSQLMSRLLLLEGCLGLLGLETGQEQLPLLLSQPESRLLLSCMLLGLLLLFLSFAGASALPAAIMWRE